MRSPVLCNEEYGHHKRIESERNGQDRADVIHEVKAITINILIKARYAIILSADSAAEPRYARARGEPEVAKTPRHPVFEVIFALFTVAGL